MSEAEKIAARLTEGQRNAVLIYMPEEGRWRRCGLIMWSLQELGLVRRRKNPGGTTSCKATPLGNEVRAALRRGIELGKGTE